ncbi:uncharacterized protein LOC118746692 isoform X2 [Rhagoletis pomonella]|uniref:uncharacterized protein LOC118746692 isoform X2 n=1 Tax=Rhagoletis pomonella TaxID=28610 RepID=UPI00177FFF21|nr:uncharacterized protein LOC118746692 isoform X2 [Rhagoletis pomonella]
MDPDFTKKLIKLVKKSECLYDCSSPEYRNQSWKAAIWQKIAEELNTKVVCICLRTFRGGVQETLEIATRHIHANSTMLKVDYRYKIFKNEI